MPDNDVLTDMWEASRQFSRQMNKKRSLLRDAEKWAKALTVREQVPVSVLVQALLHGATDDFRQRFPASVAGDIQLLEVKQEFTDWFALDICPKETPWADVLAAAEEDSAKIIGCCPPKGVPYAISLRGPLAPSAHDAPECPRDGARTLRAMMVVPSFGLQRFYVAPLFAFCRLYCQNMVAP
jgi:hypothetical protein